MATPLHELLEHRFGVDEGTFTDALVEFADRVGPLALVDVVPASYLGEHEQATLRKVGASLAPLEASDPGPVAGLVAAHAELVARSITVPEAAQRLGVDTNRVRQRIYARSLYAFKHRGAWLIPSFQFHRRRLVPGLARIVEGLSPALHPAAVSRWFTTPNDDLLLDEEAVSPIGWLSSGGPPDQAAALAGSLDEL